MALAGTLEFYSPKHPEIVDYENLTPNWSLRCWSSINLSGPSQLHQWLLASHKHVFCFLCWQSFVLSFQFGWLFPRYHCTFCPFWLPVTTNTLFPKFAVLRSQTPQSYLLDFEQPKHKDYKGCWRKNEQKCKQDSNAQHTWDRNQGLVKRVRSFSIDLVLPFLPGNTLWLVLVKHWV